MDISSSSSFSSVCSSSDSNDNIPQLNPQGTALYKKQKLIRKIDIFNHLNEEDKIIIKSSIGSAIPAVRLSQLLNIPAHKRTKTDICELVDIIQQIKFFKEAKSLKVSHLQEIVKFFQIVNMKNGETVFEFDSEADFFYIILKGTVGINVPNPLLQSWRERWQRYNQIKKWWVTELQERKNQVLKNNMGVQDLDKIIEKTVNQVVNNMLKRQSMKPQDLMNRAILEKFRRQTIHRESLTYQVTKFVEHDDHQHRHKHKSMSSLNIKQELHLSTEEINMIKEYQDFQKVQWFVEAVTLEEGLSFGELALIDGKPRRATVKCHEDCTFAIYSKAQYKKIFEDIEKQEKINKYKLFQQLPFLSHWSIKSVQNLTISFRQRNYIKNQIVYNQNDTSNEVYIVQNGEFQISREKKIKTNVRQNYESLLGPKKGKNIQPVQNKTITMKLPLSVVGSLQIFGHEDVLRGRLRTTQVTCKSLSAMIYCISAQEFIARFIKDDKSWTMLKQIAQQNDKHLLERVKLNSKMKKIETNYSQNTINSQHSVSPSESRNTNMDNKAIIGSADYTQEIDLKNHRTLQNTINFKAQFNSFQVSNQNSLKSSPRIYETKSYPRRSLDNTKNSQSTSGLFPTINQKQSIDTNPYQDEKPERKYHFKYKKYRFKSKSDVSNALDMLNDFQREKDVKYFKIAMQRKVEQ